MLLLSTIHRHAVTQNRRKLPKLFVLLLLCVVNQSVVCSNDHFLLNRAENNRRNSNIFDSNIEGDSVATATTKPCSVCYSGYVMTQPMNTIPIGMLNDILVFTLPTSAGTAKCVDIEQLAQSGQTFSPDDCAVLQNSMEVAFLCGCTIPFTVQQTTNPVSSTTSTKPTIISSPTVSPAIPYFPSMPPSPTNIVNSPTTTITSHQMILRLQNVSEIMNDRIIDAYGQYVENFLQDYYWDDNDSGSENILSTVTVQMMRQNITAIVRKRRQLRSLNDPPILVLYTKRNLLSRDDNNNNTTNAGSGNIGSDELSVYPLDTLLNITAYYNVRMQNNTNNISPRGKKHHTTKARSNISELIARIITNNQSILIHQLQNDLLYGYFFRSLAKLTVVDPSSTPSTTDNNDYDDTQNTRGDVSSPTPTPSPTVPSQAGQRQAFIIGVVLIGMIGIFSISVATYILCFKNKKCKPMVSNEPMECPAMPIPSPSFTSKFSSIIGLHKESNILPTIYDIDDTGKDDDSDADDDSPRDLAIQNFPRVQPSVGSAGTGAANTATCTFASFEKPCSTNEIFHPSKWTNAATPVLCTRTFHNRGADVFDVNDINATQEILEVTSYSVAISNNKNDGSLGDPNFGIVDPCSRRPSVNDDNIVGGEVTNYVDLLTPNLEEDNGPGLSTSNRTIDKGSFEADRHHRIQRADSFEVNDLIAADSGSSSSYSQTSDVISSVRGRKGNQLMIKEIICTSNYRSLLPVPSELPLTRNDTNALATYLRTKRMWSDGEVPSSSRSSNASPLSAMKPGGRLSGDSSATSSTRSDSTNMKLYGLRAKTIMAPPGKLGIAIDTTCEGPIVYKVDENSPLVQALRPGDLIIAINDKDTRAMSGSVITKLMVETVGTPRKLVVLREEDTNRAYI